MIEHLSPFRLTAPRVGFIGTSERLNPHQLGRVRSVLVGFAATEIHLGGRTEPDAQILRLADELGLWRFAHPDTEDLSASILDTDGSYRAASHEKSQAGIIEVSQALIFAPGATEKPESGSTWAVVHLAEAQEKPVVVVDVHGGVIRASSVVFGKAMARLRPW